MSRGKGVVAAGACADGARRPRKSCKTAATPSMPALAGVFMTFVAEAVFSSPGGGGFLDGAPGRERHLAPVRFLRRDAAQARGRRARSNSSDLRRFRPRQAGVSYRARLERHTRRGAWPVRHSRSALHAADAAPGRAGGARGTRRFPVERVPGLSLHRDRPDPDRQRKRGAHLRPDGKPMLRAGEAFRNAESCRNLEWLAEDGARLFLDGDVGQAIVTEQPTSAATSPRTTSPPIA